MLWMWCLGFSETYTQRCKGDGYTERGLCYNPKNSPLSFVTGELHKYTEEWIFQQNVECSNTE